MPEHTPAPTPSRSVYGFVLYLGSKIFFIFYLLWALLPESWLEEISISLPKKYWAVTIPVFLLTLLATFAFIIYPSINLCMTPNLNDMKTITDSFSKKKKIALENKLYTNYKRSVHGCSCENENNCYLKEYFATNKDSKKYRIPMVEDLCMEEVSKTLYLK